MSSQRRKTRRWWGAAVGETVVLLHLPPPSQGVSIGMVRGRQQYAPRKTYLQIVRSANVPPSLLGLEERHCVSAQESLPLREVLPSSYLGQARDGCGPQSDQRSP